MAKKYTVEASFCVDISGGSICFLKGDTIEINDVNKEIVEVTHKHNFKPVAKEGDEKEGTKNLDEEVTTPAKVVKEEEKKEEPKKVEPKKSTTRKGKK